MVYTHQVGSSSLSPCTIRRHRSVEDRDVGIIETGVRFSLVAPAAVGQQADREFRKLETQVRFLSAAPCAGIAQW